MAGHGVKNIFALVDEPINEMNEEDDATQMSAMDNMDARERQQRVQDQLSLSGYEAGGSVHKNHSSEQVNLQVNRATKAVNAFDGGRNLMDTIKGINNSLQAQQESTFQKRHRI